MGSGGWGVGSGYGVWGGEWVPTPHSLGWEYSIVYSRRLIHLDYLLFIVSGCDLGDAYSCGNLSVMYKKGDGVEMNEDMAKHYKRKADSIISMHTENRPNVTFGQ